MAREMTKPKVFRSMAELREHFFPEKAKKEREIRKIETILDESKHDRPNHKRQLAKEQEQDLAREMGL